MFLRATRRKKDGKEHRYWSVVENRRVSGGRVVQKQVLYLGELNESQHASWTKTADVFEREEQRAEQLSMFRSERELEPDEAKAIAVCISEMSLTKPRQWGACWLALELWNQLQLDTFWSSRLPRSRKGTRWLHVLKVLVCYRLIDPGSEWRLHREWYDRSALGDLLGEDFSVAALQTLYRCHDLLVAHKDALCQFLQKRWGELFGAHYDVMLYDLTSTYFESEPQDGESLRRFGYSRDKRSDCVQIVIALVLTTDGLPVAYEVLPGNTKDDQTLKKFLEKIESIYGKANRIWIMDRGVPTEEVLQQMRESSPKARYLVGAPRGRLTKLERSFLSASWSKVRDSVDVKLVKKDSEVYVLARSGARTQKEKAIRQRRLKRLWKRLHELQNMKGLTRDQLLVKLGEAKKDAKATYKLIEISLPPKDAELVTASNFTYSLNKEKLRKMRHREGAYLLRSNIDDQSDDTLWKWYLQLVEIEDAFRNLKGDLNLRPVYHQNDSRVEAHVFLSFLSYCLHTTLKQRLRPHAPGLTPRAVLEKFRAIQMVDVNLPTECGRTLVMSRYTQPGKDQQILLDRLGLVLPAQPKPRISQAGAVIN